MEESGIFLRIFKGCFSLCSNSMYVEPDFSKLARFGITENDISCVHKSVTEYILHTKPKEIIEPTIIFSDLHANLSSLQTTLKFAQEKHINSFISLGDLIEYNTQNDEVLDLLSSMNGKFISNIKGNHDDGDVQEDYFISSLFQEHIKKELGEFLLTLPPKDVISVNGKKILLCHSNPWNFDVLYLFPERKNIFEFFLLNLPCDGFIFGHTHFVTFYTSLDGKKFAFNPGSLGLSRDGNSTLYFSILYPQDQKIENYEFGHDSDYNVIENDPPRKVSVFFF